MDSVRELFLRQAGVIAREQALAAGTTRRQIDRLLRDREWLRVHPGVYRLHAVVPTPETSARAAALWWARPQCSPDRARAGGGS